MNTRALVVFALIARLTATAAPALSEAELRTMTDALVNLPRYVEWPPGVFVVPGTSLILGVYGHSKMHKQIVEAVNGKSLNGRLVMVRRYYWPQVPNCHLLFIARSEKCRLPWIMKKLRYTSVLTVSELDGFLGRGGMVRMSCKDDKVRFQVHTSLTEEAGLKFSSRFLELTEKIVEGP